MDIRRYITFIIVMLAFMFAWNNFGPKFFPGMFPPPQKKVAQNENDKKKEPGVINKDNDKQDDKAGKKDDKDKIDKKDPAIEPVSHSGLSAKEIKAKLAEKAIEVSIGSLDQESGYYLKVNLSSTGAVMSSVELNENPRFLELKYKAPIKPIKVVGNISGSTSERTFGMTVEAFNDQVAKRVPLLKGTEWLNEINWEIVPDSQTESAVAFRASSPDKTIEVTKKFSLIKNKSPQEANSREMRETNGAGYKIDIEISFRNLGKEDQELKYLLQGPVGLPLENKIHTREFRTVKWGLVEADGDLYNSYQAAAKLAKATDNDEVEELRKPIGYIGVDVQYFAAFISPIDDRTPQERIAKPWFEFSIPQLIQKQEPTTQSDISVQLISTPFIVSADGKPVVRTFAMFAGPKRKGLLASAPFHAEESLDLGWFSIVSKGMLAILKFLHNTLYIHYGIAIICLTVMVRGLMFPISRKQVASAEKMKAFQPKLAALKEKFGDDKEKMAKAQMELFRKHGYNPLAGCLPMVIQLPIFIGLYRMLNTAVDLRRVPFLWFDNLAAPDHLFDMGFDVYFFRNHFNLLPVLTVVLFYAQQKIMTPPATTPEQAQQQKMMSFMMLFMGVLFYHVPAGLCVYFIVSSGWGLIERKLLAMWEAKHPKPALAEIEATGQTGKNGESGEPKEKGFFGRLLDIADKAVNEAKTKQSSESNGQSSGKKKNKSRKKKKR